MNRQKGIVIGLLLLFGCLSFKMEYRTASAAGANVSIQSDVNPVVQGEIFYVIITVTSDQELNGFEGYFSYNQGVMKYITGGSVSSGNDDEFSITDTNREEASCTLKYSIQFKARRSGSSTIALKSSSSIYSAQDSAKLSVASDCFNIRVLSKKEARQQAGGAVDEQQNLAGEDGKLTSGEDNTELSEVGKTEKDKSRKEEKNSPFPENTLQEAGEKDLLPTGTMQNSGKETVEDEDRPKEGAQQETMPNSTQTGLNKTTCMVILTLAVAGLVMLAVLARELRQLPEEDFGEEEQPGVWDMPEQSDIDRESKENRREETVEPVEEPREREESMEEIAQRLERKRSWLNDKR